MLSFGAEYFVFRFDIQIYKYYRIYRTVILTVVLYGCETWSLTLREELRLRMLRIFGPKRHEVKREWRKLLIDMYSSPNIVPVIKLRRIRWGGHVVCMGEKRGIYRVLVGKPERKRPLGRHKHIWEDNIKMDLQEVEWGHGLDLNGSG